jgi:hypothetical protein
MNDSKHTNWKKRSYFGPILLIIAGLLFLAHNLGFVPGEGWDTIWKLWPVLLVVAGLDDLIRGEGIAWPILLIGAGAFLLYNYFGPQAWISWTQIVQLWPIILIAVGIDIMFKGGSGWSTVLGVVLTIALVGGAIWIVTSETGISAEYTDIRHVYQADTTNSDLDLSLGFGELILSSAATEGVLIEGRISPSQRDEEKMESASGISYKLENNQPAIYPNSSRWELGLADDLELDLSAHNGVGEMFLSLEQLDLEALDINQGVGRLIVRLPAESAGDLFIKQAIGTIRVVIPDGKNVIVDAQNGLTKIDFPAGFELGSGFYASPGANKSNADLKITVEQAIGVVKFQYSQ